MIVGRLSTAAPRVVLLERFDKNDSARSSSF